MDKELPEGVESDTKESTKILMPDQYPKEVKDKKAYGEYIKLKQHPFLNKKQIISVSDGTQINLGWFPNIIKGKIKHLEATEQKLILIKKDLYQKVLVRCTHLKRKALGVKIGSDAYFEVIFKDKKAELIELFGRMFSVKEVHEIMIKSWKMGSTPITYLQEFRKHYAETIALKIEAHKRDFSDIRLGVKKSRLEELIELYRDRKKIYEMTHSRQDADMLIKIIVELRKEAEGDRLVLEGSIDVRIEEAVTEHLRKEVFKTINIKEIIVSRVAARMGTSGVEVITALHKSYYRKFNVEVIGDGKDAESVLQLPSAQTYDFDKIKRIHQKALMEAANSDDTKPVVIVTEDKKKTLMNMLKRSRETVITSRLLNEEDKTD